MKLVRTFWRVEFGDVVGDGAQRQIAWRSCPPVNPGAQNTANYGDVGRNRR
jgi:hypothetical protein